MEILKELVDLHRQNRTLKVRILGQRKGRNATALYKLYEAVYKKKVSTDEEAMIFLFGEGAVNDLKVRKRYSNLKKRLERKLTNGLFLIELREDKMKRQVVTELYKLYAAAQILGRRQAIHASIGVARRGLKGAQRYGDIKLAMDFCDLLVRRYAFKGEVKKVAMYRELSKEYEEQVKYSKQVNDLYLDLAAFFSKAQGVSEEEVGILGRRLAELKKSIPGKAVSLWTMSTLYLVESVYLQLVAAHEDNIRLCRKAFAVLEKRSESVPPGTLIQLLTGELASHIYLGHREEAEQLAAKLRMMKADFLDWYRPYRISILARLWFKDYQGAFELFLEVLQHRAYKKNKLHLEEDWRMLHAYLYFFYREGLISTEKVRPEVLKVFTNFRLARFMNEMPVYMRDKRGYNVSLLNIQALLWLQERKLDRFLEKIDALKTYNYKHLRRNQTFRSHSYLKMLIRLVNIGFRRLDGDKRIEELLEELRAFPMKTLEVEIVPYEHQWEFVLKLMHALYRH